MSEVEKSDGREQPKATPAPSQEGAVPGRSTAVETTGDAADPPPGAKAALAEMSSVFGHSFDDVRIHTGPEAAQKTASLGTKAVTMGRNIYFAPSVFNPSTPEGKRILAHELTHVVQQRGGAGEKQQAYSVGQRGDKYEQEAHRSADAVLSGQQPTIQESTSDAIAMRDEEGPPRLDYTAYLAKYGKQIIAQAMKELQGLEVHPQCIFATWKTSSAAVFDAIATRITANASWMIANNELPLLCAPESVVAAINRGRGVDGEGKSEDAFQPAAGTELRNMLVRRFTESVARLMPRYAHATNTYFSQQLGPVLPDIHSPEDPPIDLVILGAPIDKYVAPALRGRVKVDLKNYRDAHPNEKPVVKPRKVAYTFAAQQAASSSEGKLNFVQITDKLDPPVTAEDVAFSIFGRSELASFLTPAAGLWGFTHPDHLLQYEQWKKLPGNTGENDPNNYKYDESKSDPAKQILSSADADKAALEQGKGVGGTGKGTKDVVVARMRMMLSIVEGMKQEVVGAGLNAEGLASLATRLDGRSTKVLAEPVNASNAQSPWDGQSAEQLDILGQCAGGIKTAAGSWKALMHDIGEGGKAPAHLADPVKKLMNAFLDAATVSDLVETARGRLAHAHETLVTYPIDVAEGILSFVHQLVEEASRTVAGSTAEGQTGHSTEELTQKEKDLRARCAALRTLIHSNPAAAGEELKKIQAEVKELQHHGVVIALVRRSEDLGNTMYNLGQSFGANKDWSKLWHPIDKSKQSGSKKQRYEQATAELDALKNLIFTTVVAPAKAGNLEGAYAALGPVQAKYQEKFKTVAELIESEEAKEKWIKIGVMIGAGIMTAGFADAVAAVAVTDLAMSGTGLAAVKVTAEAGAFTAITQSTIETDHSLKSITMAFFQNLATFTLVGKAMQSYKAAFPAFAESFGGQVIGNAGMFVAHCSAGLAAADAKKYLETGKHLDEHEIHDSIEEGVLVTIGTIIGERVTHTFLHGFHPHDPGTKSKIDTINDRRAATKPKADALTKGGKADAALATLKEDGETIDLERASIHDLDEAVKDPAKAKNAGYTDAEIQLIKTTKGTVDAADASNKLLQISAGLRSLGGDNFAADGSAVFDGAMKSHRDAGNEITISKDPVTGQRVAVIKTKGENPQTIRIVEDTTGGVMAKPEQSLPLTPGEQKGVYNATEMRRLEQEYTTKKQTLLGRLKAGPTGDDFTIDDTTANLGEVTQTLRELGWKTVEVVDGEEVVRPDGTKHKLRSARFEAEPDVYGEHPPYEQGKRVLRVKETKPPASPKDKVTPEQWKSVKAAIKQHQAPNVLDLPETSGNLEGSVKLEKLNRDAWLNADGEGKALVQKFYNELSHYLEAQSEPITDLNDAVQKIIGTPEKSQYLMKGPKITESEAQDMGDGAWRGVNYEALAGNGALTQEYYGRLLKDPEAASMGLPTDVSEIKWKNGKDIAKLMSKTPPDPMKDLDPNKSIGNPFGPGWWGSGEDPGIPSPAPPTMDAKSYAEAVAAVNLAGGGVLFKLEPAQLTGGAKDAKGNPSFARRPTQFDALWNPQFNPHPMGGENWGKTTPDPSNPKVKKVREVIMPVMNIGASKSRTLLK